MEVVVSSIVASFPTNLSSQPSWKIFAVELLLIFKTPVCAKKSRLSANVAVGKARAKSANHSYGGFAGGGLRLLSAKTRPLTLQLSYQSGLLLVILKSNDLAAVAAAVGFAGLQRPA